MHCIHTHIHIMTPQCRNNDGEMNSTIQKFKTLYSFKLFKHYKVLDILYTTFYKWMQKSVWKCITQIIKSDYSEWRHYK